MLSSAWCKFSLSLRRYAMAEGKYLDLLQMERIEALFQERWSISHIAKYLNISKHSITNFKVKGLVCGGLKEPGRMPKIAKRQRSIIFLRFCNSFITSNQIKAEFKLTLSWRTVSNVRSACPTFTRRIVKMKPVLLQQQNDAKFRWAKNRMTWTTKWESVVVSDENRSTLDGPDSYMYNFHDIRREDLTCTHIHNGGGSVRIWAFIVQE